MCSRRPGEMIWLFLLASTVRDVACAYKITAKDSSIEVTNSRTASLQWDFTFPDNQVVYIHIATLTRSSQEKTQIAFRGGGSNQQFVVFKNMQDRVKITIPARRSGVIVDISNIAINDEGKYRCKVTFVDGSVVNSTINLIVIVPPRINKRQRQVYRNEGQNATLECTLEAGNPQPMQFRWVKIIGRQTQILTEYKQRWYRSPYNIPYVGRDNVGKFRCEVHGRGGLDRHTVELFVKYKPVVTAPPLNRSVYEESGIESLTCTCEGNAGTTRYHWYKDRALPEYEIKATNRKWVQQRIEIVNGGKMLKFTRPVRALAGMYFCAGSNDLGLGRAKGAWLSVTYRPGEIEIETAERNVVNEMEDSNITVPCRSDANPPAHYNWFKLVKTFLGGHEEIPLVRASTTGDLKLYNVNRNDTADYICEAFNRPNDENRNIVEKKSKKIRLNIRFGPRQTNFTINDNSHTHQELTLYSRVVMKCVAHSEPGANFNIRREIDQTQLNKNIKTGLYEIDRLEESDEGSYLCFASNTITSKHQMKKIRLVVAVPPTTLDPVPDSRQAIKEGSTVAIKCHAKGKPAPRVYWQRWGANITSNDSVIQTSYKVRPLKLGTLFIVDAELKFTRIRYSDDASYSCIVHNSGGSKNISNIRYHVQYPPKLTPHGYPANFTRREGQEATFVCQAHARPEPVQWKWLFNGKEILGAASNTYTRAFTKRQDNGEYQCVPRNGLGDGQVGTGYLEVQYEPEFTLRPQVNYTKDKKDSIQISCDAKAVPDPTIFWIKATDSTFYRAGKNLVFDSLDPGNRGEYSCLARNVVSTTKVSTTLIIRHGPIITTNTPSDTKIGSKNGSPVFLQCDVEAYPEPIIQWKEYRNDNIIRSGSEYKIEERTTSIFSKSSFLKFTVGEHQLGKKYICYTHNKYGYSNQQYQVLVQGRPDPPELGSLKAVDKLVPSVPVTVDINLTWIPGYTGGAEVQYYLLYKEKGWGQYREQFMGVPEGFKYVFKYRKTSTEYEFTMKSKNKYGVSRLYEPPLIFNTRDAPADVANVTYQRYGKDGTMVIITWHIFPIPSKRRRRSTPRKWSYGIVRYRIADVETQWTQQRILKIATQGNVLIKNLEAEQLYVFHFILFDEEGNFGNPLLVGRFYPRYGAALPSLSDLTKTDIIAIGVGCGGATLIVSVIILVIAICKKKKPSYGIVSYGNGRARVDIPVSTTMRSGGYTGEVVRGSYLQPDDEYEDEDPLDSASAIDVGDKSPPPDYNDIHYSLPPGRDGHPHRASVPAEVSPLYTTFGRNNNLPLYDSKGDKLNLAVSQQSLGNRPPEISRGHNQNRHSFDALGDNYGSYHGSKVDLDEPLLMKSIQDLDEKYQEPERRKESRYSRGRISSDENVSIDNPSQSIRMPPDEPDNNRVPGAFGDRVRAGFKKTSYTAYDDEAGSITSPHHVSSGRISPNGSSVASSKPYRSDNEYIEDAEENYVGYLV